MRRTVAVLLVLLLVVGVVGCDAPPAFDSRGFQKAIEDVVSPDLLSDIRLIGTTGSQGRTPLSAFVQLYPSILDDGAEIATNRFADVVVEVLPIILFELEERERGFSNISFSLIGTDENDSTLLISWDTGNGVYGDYINNLHERHIFERDVSIEKLPGRTIPLQFLDAVPAPEIIFSTPASENGLGDTQMYITGTVVRFPQRSSGSWYQPMNLLTDYGSMRVLSRPPSRFNGLAVGDQIRVEFMYLGMSTEYDVPNGTLLHFEFLEVADDRHPQIFD
ncbi:MAG: hypothetical protein FWE08_06185 [Oscillospiraceae bacterium]|nr:hypothetical protein [Oscillospiraceae bacterium]